MFNKSNNQSNWMNKFILVLACLSFFLFNTFVLIFLYFSFYFYIVIYSWKLVSYIYIFFLFLFYSILYLLQVFLKFTEHTNLYIIKLKNNILKKDIILTLVKILTFKIIFIIVCFSFNISYLSLNQIDTTGLAMFVTGVTIMALAITIKHSKDLNKEFLVQKQLLKDTENRLEFTERTLKLFLKGNKDNCISPKPLLDSNEIKKDVIDHIDTNKEYIKYKYGLHIMDGEENNINNIVTSIKQINRNNTVMYKKFIDKDTIENIREYNEQYHIELLHRICHTKDVDISDNYLFSNSLDSNYIITPLNSKNVKDMILNQNQGLIDLNLILNSDAWDYRKCGLVTNLCFDKVSSAEKMLIKAKMDAVSRLNLENVDKIEIIKCAIVNYMYNINENIQIISSDKTSIPLKLKYFPHVERDLESLSFLIKDFIIHNKFISGSSNHYLVFENYLHFINSLKSQCFYYHYAIKANADNIALGFKKSFSESDLQHLKKPVMEYQKDIVENVINIGKDIAENNTTIFCYNLIIDFFASTLGNFFPFLKLIPHIKDITDEKESISSEVKVNEEDFKELDSLYDKQNFETCNDTKDSSDLEVKTDSVNFDETCNDTIKKDSSDLEVKTDSVNFDETCNDTIKKDSSDLEVTANSGEIFRKKEDPSDNEYIENTP